MNILIICGESSSNALGAKLAKVLLNSNHHVFSFGNERIAKVSTQLMAIDTTQHSVSYGQWRKKRAFINHMTAILNESTIRFDKAVIIDFPSYNFNIASTLKQFQIPIVTFVTPNFWIWKNKRQAQKILNYSQDVITIFKPEFDLYSSLNKNKTHYFGHPIRLEIQKRTPQSNAPFFIGIFPGSRHGEVHHHLPIMLKIVQYLAKFKFVIFCEQPSLHPVIQHYLSLNNLSHIEIQTELDLSIDYAITAPGTNSLKLALQGFPLTIIGYLNFWVYLIAKYILRLNVNFIGLPNIILNRQVFPEFIQPKLNEFKNIGNHVLGFFENLNRDQYYKDDFKALEDITFAPENYYDKVADLIIK